MSTFDRMSLAAGPSFSDKGKAKEILGGVPPPAWYPLTSVDGAEGIEDEEAQLEASWWSTLNKDDSYVGGIPAVPIMASRAGDLALRRRGRKRRRDAGEHSLKANGHLNGQSPMRIDDGPIGVASPSREKTPPLVKSKPRSLESVVLRSIDKLSEARKYINQVQEFQRAELEGGVLPPLDLGETSRAVRKEERAARHRRRQLERAEAQERAEQGGEVGETEAAFALKRSSAALLAHAGFEGASVQRIKRGDSADLGQERMRARWTCSRAWQWTTSRMSGGRSAFYLMASRIR